MRIPTNEETVRNRGINRTVAALGTGCTDSRRPDLRMAAPAVGRAVVFWVEAILAWRCNVVRCGVVVLEIRNP